MERVRGFECLRRRTKMLMVWQFDIATMRKFADYIDRNEGIGSHKIHDSIYDLMSSTN